MSRQELIDSLRQKGEEKAREIWRLAEEKAAGIRAEASALVERERIALGGDRQGEAEGEVRAIRLAAEREARRIVANARRHLADLLYAAALTELPTLRKEGGSVLFAALAAEFPDIAWEEVQVNPAELQLATRHFPDARIASEAEISGGLIVIGQGGRVRIDNTLEKRLERSWDLLLPALLKKVEEEAS